MYWKPLNSKSIVPDGTMVRRNKTGAGFKEGEIYQVKYSTSSRKDDNVVFHFEDDANGFAESFSVEVPDESDRRLDARSLVKKGSILKCKASHYKDIHFNDECTVEADSGWDCSVVQINSYLRPKVNFEFVRHESLSNKKFSPWQTVICNDKLCPFPWEECVVVEYTRITEVKIYCEGRHWYVQEWYLSLPELKRVDVSNDPIKSCVAAFKKWISERESHEQSLRFDHNATIPVGTMIKRVQESNTLTVWSFYCVMESNQWYVKLINDRQEKTYYDSDCFVPAEQHPLAGVSEYNLSSNTKETTEAISPLTQVPMSQLTQEIRNDDFTPEFHDLVKGELSKLIKQNLKDSDTIDQLTRKKAAMSTLKNELDEAFENKDFTLCNELLEEIKEQDSLVTVKITSTVYPKKKKVRTF